MRALALVLCLFATTAHAQTTKLVIGINSLTAIYWPTYVARAKGMFAANGIEPDVVLDGSPVAGLQQLLAGSLDIAHPTLSVAVNGAAKGARFVIIGCIVPSLPYSMVSAPGVTSLKDVHTVSLGYKTDVLTSLWQGWVRAQGVDPATIDVVYDAQASHRYAALASHVAQAALLNAPFDLRAKADGGMMLVDLGPPSDGYGMSAVSVRPEWLITHRAQAQAYVRAQQQAVAWLYDPANKDDAVRILSADTKQDLALSEATWADYVGARKPFSRDLSVPKDALAKSLAAAISAGDVVAGSTLPQDLVQTP